MDPYLVAGCSTLSDGVRKAPVDLDIGCPVVGLEATPRLEVMKQGPDHLIRKAEVERVALTPGEVNADELVPGGLGCRSEHAGQIRHAVLDNVARPAQPQAATLPQNRPERIHQATCGSCRGPSTGV